MKKFTSLFALLLGLSVFSAKADISPVTIHVYVTDPDITPIIHYWDANEGESNWDNVGQSGGDQYLTSETINGIPFYTITLHTHNDYPNGIQIILRDGNGHQTDNIPNLKNSEYYITYATDSYNGSGHQDYYWTAIRYLGISFSSNWSTMNNFEFDTDSKSFVYTLDASELTDNVIFSLRPNEDWAGYTNGNATNPNSWFEPVNNGEGGYNFSLKHQLYAYDTYKLKATWNPSNNDKAGWTINVEGLNPVYTVVGDEALVGSDWNTYDINNEMIDGGDLYYSLKKTVNLNPGRYGFKVVTNHKYTESWPGDNNWWVDISEAGVYNLSFVFDRGNGDLLSCNGWDEGPSTDVVLDLTDETPFTATTGFTVSTALYSRECANQWGTLCLPFKFSAAQSGVTFYEMTDVTTGENGAITFTPIDGMIAAGQPVAFKLEDGASYLNVENSDENGVAVVTEAGTSEPVSGWSMHGTFKNTTLNNVYVIQANEIHPTGSGLSIKPYRAWFSGSVSGAPLRIEVADTEGLQFVEQEDGTVKAYFDLQGRKLDSARKGLVIENGKIIMVK